jgi:hypothetical protein
MRAVATAAVEMAQAKVLDFEPAWPQLAEEGLNLGCPHGQLRPVRRFLRNVSNNDQIVSRLKC